MCAYCRSRITYPELINLIASISVGFLFVFSGALLSRVFGEQDLVSFLVTFVVGGVVGSTILLPFSLLLPLVRAKD